MEAQGMEGPMTSTLSGQDANVKDGILVKRVSAHQSLRTGR